MQPYTSSAVHRGPRQKAVSLLLALCLALALFTGLGLTLPLRARADDTIDLSSLMNSAPTSGNGWAWDETIYEISINAPGTYFFDGALASSSAPPPYACIQIKPAAAGAVKLVGTASTTYERIYIQDLRPSADLTLENFSIVAPVRGIGNPNALEFAGTGAHTLNIVGAVSLQGPVDTATSNGACGGILSRAPLTIHTAAGNTLQVVAGSNTVASGGGISTTNVNDLTFTGEGTVNVIQAINDIGSVGEGLFGKAITINGPAVSISMPGSGTPTVTSAAVATTNDNLNVTAGSLTVTGLNAPLPSGGGNHLIHLLAGDLNVAAGASITVTGHAGALTALNVQNNATVAGTLVLDADLDATPIGGPASMAYIGGVLTIPAGGSASFSGALGDHQLLRVSSIAQGGTLSLVSSRGGPLTLAGAHSFTDETALLQVTNGGDTAISWAIDKPAGTSFYYNPATALPTPSNSDVETFYFAGAGLLTMVSLTPLSNPTPTPTPEEEVAPTVAPPASPQTGDTAHTGLWTVLGALCLCGLAMCGVALCRRRSGHSN